MQKRKLEDLNLIDDFLFFSMMNDEVMGEEFGRCLLEIIFDRKFGKLKIVPQKVYYGTDTDKHGVRLDVYLEEQVDNESLLESSAIYDIEPESMEKKSEKDSLPKRVRFYHSKIDSGCLGSGVDYQLLKKVIVVMIMPFDPFGYDHMIYTIRNTCLEVPELPYDDGAKTMFLYTKGTKGNPTEGLRELLRYFEDTKAENAKNEKLQTIHNMVKTVKRVPEVSKGYMKIYEKERMLIKHGREEGRAEGRAEIVRFLREFGKTDEEILRELVVRLNISADKAQEYLKSNS